MKQPQLGIRIAELRNKKGLTQKELAEACNIDIRTIQRIESGEVLPRMYTIKLLSKTLDVEITEFNGDPETKTPEINQQLRLAFIAGVIFSVNYIPVMFQVIKKPFGTYLYGCTIVIHMISFIIFERGFYLLGKQSNNQVLFSSAFLSMLLIPVLNIMDLFKNYFGWMNLSTVFTAVCMNAFILGIGLWMESARRAHLSNLYKIAGVATLVQTVFFLSQDLNFIITGVIISILSNFITTYILYSETIDAKKRSWRSNVSAA